MVLTCDKCRATTTRYLNKYRIFITLAKSVHTFDDHVGNTLFHLVPNKLKVTTGREWQYL